MLIYSYPLHQRRRRGDQGPPFAFHPGTSHLGAAEDDGDNDKWRGKVVGLQYYELFHQKFAEIYQQRSLDLTPLTTELEAESDPLAIAPSPPISEDNSPLPPDHSQLNDSETSFSPLGEYDSPYLGSPQTTTMMILDDFVDAQYELDSFNTDSPLIESYYLSDGHSHFSGHSHSSSIRSHGRKISQKLHRLVGNLTLPRGDRPVGRSAPKTPAEIFRESLFEASSHRDHFMDKDATQ